MVHGLSAGDPATSTEDQAPSHFHPFPPFPHHPPPSSPQPEEVTALAWNPAAPQLALGTAKGGGLTYDLATRAATPLVLGRAAKPVCCMAWSPGAAPGGLLALGCRGGALLLCRAADGGLVRSVQLKAALSQLQFCELEGGPADRRCSSGSGGGGGSLPRAGALLAGNVGRRSVCIWQLPQALSAAEGGSGGGGDAFELAFREGYGELEAYTFVHPRLLVAAFSSGQVVAFSFNGVTPAGGLMPGTGTELFSQRCLQAPAAGLSWCSAAGTLAVGGGRQVALLSCRGQQVALEGDTADLGSALEPGAQRVAALHCCPDGRLLTVLSSTGRLAQLLARTPLLHGVWGAQVAFVDPSASPRQALLLSVDQPSAPVAHPLPVEPELLALGPGVLAASQGCMVRQGFWRWGG